MAISPSYMGGGALSTGGVQSKLILIGGIMNRWRSVQLPIPAPENCKNQETNRIKSKKINRTLKLCTLATNNLILS